MFKRNCCRFFYIGPAAVTPGILQVIAPGHTPPYAGQAIHQGFMCGWHHAKAYLL